ncbi:glycosyltransferase family 2 protein [Antarctobacter sp.]|uniref:glycosyltransferase family 2 protein n=1 Tax=Antarctobacter sp. TaxID=1872577 RepID=UPI003A8DA50A
MRFTIVIPACNAAETLPATLASLTAQGFADWEALVVDDGSTDATRALVKEAAQADSRIVLLVNPGKGPSDARNFGAARARGQILTFCDADDLWEPDKLAGLAQAFDATGSDALFGQIGFFNVDPQSLGTLSTVPAGAVTVQMLLGENPVCTMSNLSVRAEVFAALGGFRADMVHNEDLEFLIRLVGEGCVLRGIDRLHVRYRASTGGLSADLDRMQRGRAEALKTARRYGVAPDARAEAVHLRYLARRALRLDQGPHIARRLALRGMRLSPRAFLMPPRRGVATAGAALIAPCLPTALRRALFAH